MYSSICDEYALCVDGKTVATGWCWVRKLEKLGSEARGSTVDTCALQPAAQGLGDSDSVGD